MYYFFRSLFSSIFIGKPPAPVDPPVGSGNTEPLPEDNSPKIYDLISTTYSEPYRGVDLGPTTSMYVFTGSTTYLFQERATGKFEKQVVMGAESTPLTILFEKVNEQGPTRIVHNGKTYLLGVVEPQGIPVR